jgi:hypothetical protein
VLEVRQAEAAIIHRRFPLGLHAPQSHTYPPIQSAVHVATRGPRTGKVVCCPSNNAIQLHDQIGIQVVTASRHFFDFVFELLYGFIPHPNGPGTNLKTQEGEAFLKGRDVCLFRTQSKTKLISKQFANQFQCLLGLVFGFAKHDEVVSVSHKAIAGFFELPIQEV